MRTIGLVLLSCSLLLGAAVAQDKTMGATNAPEVVKSYLKQAKFVQGELTSLARAIPQDKYSYRPEKGVRSVSESFMHAALGNYVMLQTLGGKAPESFDMKTYETSATNKEKVVAELESSFQAVNEFIEKIPENEYSQVVKFFGMDMTKLDIIFVTATHQHETLGQAIAYARVNHVTPPWTEAQQARAKATKK